MARILKSVIAVIGIDIGKNSFHVVGCDKRGAIMLRQRWSRGLGGILVSRKEEIRPPIAP